MSKLIVIIGITGNQGGSVARRFLQDPTYRIRGTTRNPSSPAAQELSALGIEIVKADLDNVETLVPAFQGANLIFSVTNYWEPFFRPDCRAAAAAKNISCRKYAYEVEYQQGKNIADAASQVVGGLDELGFVASTLSHAGKSSGGRFKELYHFDSKADVFPDYVVERYPDLVKKMSFVQTGYFTSSYKLAPGAYFRKMPNGTYQMSFPTAPTFPVPHLCVNADVGPFVYAVTKMGPGKHYMCESGTCSWTDFMKLWSEITGKTGVYKQISIEQMVEGSPDKPFGAEIADMFAYSSEPGYDGGDESLLKKEDIRKAGIDCPMTSLEEWIKNEDWSIVWSQ